ncbi:hypothetical protein [Deinococcus multiflagellatus]|uniref:PRTRC system protein B n=1 Tax=Deinococcus multiflagellatus TaxID=1656887 RepID=A0ABW1ZNQ9_9DEIO|nr:hypothetical protein [Deinococcus multiflagellatus]MBZ9714888.1 hypothetical protein [Deinococcus multiflagellatus]
MTLQMALLVYANHQQMAVMRSEISVVNGQAQLNNAVEVTNDTVASLLKLTNRRPLTLVGEEVLALSFDACAWFSPAQERPLLFNPDRDKGLAELNGRVFPMPPLVFVSRGQSIKIYALFENSKPKGTTKLALAPFYNLFDDHRLCSGGATLPSGGDPQNTEAWERVVFQSNFTHRAGQKVRWHSSHTHKELWEAAARRGDFDPTWLLPADLTLEEAVLQSA